MSRASRGTGALRGALAAGLLLVCCVLVPLAFGAACLLALGLWLELAVAAVAVGLVALALNRHCC